MPLKRLFQLVQTTDDTKTKPKDDKPPEPLIHDESNWLISYADMMTLLCGFFIMMFSMSKLDEPEFEKVKAAVARHFGGDYKSPNADLAKFVTQVIQDAGLGKDVLIRTDSFGVSMTFQSIVFFDTLSADLRIDGVRLIEKLVAAVLEREGIELKKYKVVVEGHTDSRPVVSGVYSSNWELSGARAARVARIFLQQGFDATHVIPIGYGDTHPEVADRSPAGSLDADALSKNRRVVIRVLEPKVVAIPIPEVPAPEAPPPAIPAH